MSRRRLTTLAVAVWLLAAPFSFAQTPKSFPERVATPPAPPADPFGPLPPADLARPVPAAPTDTVKQAVDMFQRAKDGEPAKFAAARDLFTQAVREKAALTADQTAAWAYCRVRCATDRLNGSTDAATAAEVIAEIEDALAAVPQQANLQTAAKDILAAARKRAGTTKAVPTADGNAVDSPSFVVKFTGRKATADELIRAAEAARADVFKRWSGPPGADWSPKCEIVLHPTADAFAAATGLPAAATGRAEVKLSGGKVTTRRIDLRADDETLLEVALPRELAHVVFADLYPTQPPPAWAGLAMAVLSTTDAEVGRYLRTARRCGEDGELPAVDKVLNAEAVPTKNVTGFHAESVAVADFLVRWKGEKAFTAFVRDSFRYGSEGALKRQYGLADTRELEAAMRKK
jgi:hypothetical protein